MSLIVEDGSMVTGAESYLSVVEADAYFKNRGNVLWDGLGLIKREQALRQATDYLEIACHGNWRGRRTSLFQPLSWPRVDVADDGFQHPLDSIPKALKQACAELAVRAAEGPLLADREQGVVREKVGPLEVEYDTNSSQQKRFTIVLKMLQPLLRGFGRGTLKLERV